MITLGEQRVRTSFNPSNDSLVDQVKQKTAELINLMQQFKDDTFAQSGPLNSEKFRLIAIAQTEYESAAMWAVKAVTM